MISGVTSSVIFKPTESLVSGKKLRLFDEDDFSALMEGLLESWENKFGSEAFVLDITPPYVTDDFSALMEGLLESWENKFGSEAFVLDITSPYVTEDFSELNEGEITTIPGKTMPRGGGSVEEQFILTFFQGPIIPIDPYYDDFSSYEAGKFPEGWISEGDESTVYVNDDPIFGRTLTLNPATNVVRPRYYHPGTLGSQGTAVAELAEMFGTEDTRFYLFIRAGLGSGVFLALSLDTLWLVEYDPDGERIIDSRAHTTGGEFLKIEADLDQVRAKVWKRDDPEPDWMLEGTSYYSREGYVGVGGNGSIIQFKTLETL